MIVDLFVPCFIDQIYPDTAFNTVKILEKLGVKVHYNPEQTCCGQPAYNSGYWKEAKVIAKKFIRDFPNDRYIVSPSASCTGFVKNYFPSLFKAEPELLKQHHRLQNNLVELTDFLVNILKTTELGAEFPHKVTYHDACTALREYGIKREPRELLAHVKGLELVEMDKTEECCGFGGTFSIKMEPISTAMAQQKIENALNTGAEYIVTTESSCLLNLEGYIRKQKHPIKTIHIADVLASGW
ncbi:MAG: (Fe-S)-binding protein [Marinifilaceae bacterium]